jgi:hypothetical protein
MTATFTTLYCTETGEFAVIERDEFGQAIVARGEVQQVGSYWYEVDDKRPGSSARQVCKGFAFSGPTLQGDGAAERTAGKVYKTAAGFAKAAATFRAIV